MSIENAKERHKLESVRDLAGKMKRNAPILSATGLAERNGALSNISKALIDNKDDIFSANKIDLSRARESGVGEAIIKRLKFDDAKLSSVISGIDTLIGLPDPLSNVSLKRELSDGLVLTRMSVPIGVIGVIFEARPDALVQIATLCIKSGNMCILKGGKETEETNRAIFDVIYKAALDSGLCEHCLSRVSLHNEIDELLTCDGAVDLLIPRGSNAFVKYIMDNTSIPVLGHADGICHTYVDGEADIELAIPVVVDAKTQYPAACNATETLLVSRKIADKFLPRALNALKEAGVTLRLTDEAKRVAGDLDSDTIADDDFRQEYLDLTIGVKLVDDVYEAVNHINSHGSHHTDAIITENNEAWEYFATMVDSAGVYRNVSTRFADGFRYGFGAEVGISTSKIHARGPVGLEGLLTYKYCLEGHGHGVSDFEKGERKFIFKDLK